MKRKIFVLQLFGFLQHENNPNTAFNRMLISFMNTQCSNVFKLENEWLTGLTRFFRVLWWLKYSGELKLKGIAALSNTKACHQAK